MDLEHNVRVQKFGNINKKNKFQHSTVQKTLNLHLLINKNKLRCVIINPNKNVRKK